jgi:hypothetical protein
MSKDQKDNHPQSESSRQEPSPIPSSRKSFTPYKPAQVITRGDRGPDESLEVSRCASTHIPMVPTANGKEKLSEAIRQIEAKVASLQTLLSEDSACHHLGEAPSKNLLSTLTVDAHLQQEDNIDIVTREDTPTRYFFILLKYSGASLTYCSPVTAQVIKDAHDDIILQDLDDLVITSQINQILNEERAGRTTYPIVVSDIKGAP